MYATGSRSPPQARAPSPPWYTEFPQLEPASAYCSQDWPPRLLRISDNDLQRIVFLQRSNRSTHDPTELRQNERTEYLGEGILRALVSDFLYHKFTTLNERDLLALQQALLDPVHLSAICQRTNLHVHLRSSPTERPPDDQVLAIMFGAYIGGIYNERGAEGYAGLRDWFWFLIEPYAVQCKANYDLYKQSRRSQAFGSDFAPSGRHSRAPSYQSGYPLDDPSMIVRPGTAAPSLGRYVTAGASSEPTRNRGSYIQDLKEYCEKHRLRSPAYHHNDNGRSGDHIQWGSTVYIGEDICFAAPSWSKSKKEADAKASKVALNNLQREASYSGY